MKKVICLIGLCVYGQAQAQSDELEEIVVRAHPLSGEGLSQSTTVLTGESLAEELQSSLGETLGSSAGIRSASFGGAVGRPVIHGLGGARIKTTEDRIDSLDVSVTSTDHAVTVEPFIASQITVLKGASTLLYGSGAIGGVVDTQTGRIPIELPDEPLSGRIELRASDNADARTGAARLDGRLGESVAWHLDAFSKQADDYEIAGELESVALRAQEGEEHDEEGSVDVLEGSRYDVDGGAFGASFLGDAGFLGMSISTLNAEYGLVGGHAEEEGDEHEEGEEHEEEEEQPGRIDLRQTRYDLEAQVNNPFAGVEKINARLGINDYQHDEIEGNGEIGTSFDNQAWEGRVELSHAPIADFTGALGLQLSGREFSALGEEAFVPPVETDSQGLFWVGERDFNAFSLETGLRFESTDHSPSLADLPDLNFSTTSASLGLIVPQNENQTWSVLLDYSERAPSIEELYSDGPHLATQRFEIGKPDLIKESGLGLTLTWNYQSDYFDATASVYRTRFNDFIYQSATGEEEDGLPVLVYLQDDARYTGIDIELGFHLAEVAGGDLDLIAKFDTVDAEVTAAGGQPLERIPSNRIGVGFAWQNGGWRTKLDYTHTSAQSDVAEFELPTDSYNDLSLRASRRIEIADQALTFFVQGRNLTDEEQRQHTSFVKDVAPAPGRRIELGVRYQF